MCQSQYHAHIQNAPVHFAGETWEASVVIQSLAAMFPVTLSAMTNNPLPALNGYFSFPLYISKVSPDAAVLYGTLHC